MTAELIILGCGNSAGTPTIGNFWGKCDPDEPKNRRTRPSVAVRTDTTTVIIDTGPDFRMQANETGIESVDAVLYSHAHADHIHGIDDLRVLRNRHKKMIPIYGMPETMDEVAQRFAYLFHMGGEGIYPKVVAPHPFEEQDYGRPHTIGDISYTPFLQDHGHGASLGFRFGDVAYSTDMVDLDENAFKTLEGIQTWVVDGAGYNYPSNPVHCTIKRVLELNETVQAQQVYLTHLTPYMDYRSLLKSLPDGYEPAYDGLRLPVSVS